MMLRRLVVRSSLIQNGQTNQQLSFIGRCKRLVVNKGITLACCTAATLYRKFSNMATLETLKFDNLVLRSLPIDGEEENYRRKVSGACFSKVKPTPVKNPQLVAVSLPAMGLLDLPLSETEREDFAEYFSGNKLLPGSETAAHCYCGHQFGYFSGQLGDGAAIYLGEIINRKGERWEIQLKGAGLTPYSRQADGRKVLRSSIREFLCSEIFKPTDEDTGRTGPSVGRKDILEKMLQYTVKTFYPQIWESYSNDDKRMYVEFYKEVIRRTARLVADWQVLNTDNMSIIGLTIDYGPYGFMDKYDPDFICNSSDDGGRYTYVKQPTICKWNCEKLAEAIQDIVPLTDTKPHLDLFDEEFGKYYTEKMRKKFGLKKELPEDKELVESFLDTMHKTGADFTNCFRCLSRLPYPGSEEFVTAKAGLS
ncbi:hypothetical protein KUTeg_015405 [Tegillarca granosa]|uniref:Selenoprotein O n=1 Tax=Tegillarca granosa TaxID=220873 RepID=A0ABQ9ESF3_TEGGR|nr:hypothetical protein KUTeg_015405 [Tegillarca granosa]